ncbi:MAG: class I SAM-dependent methyltransferase [Acetobacteraceae bacterium]|nr:class I SAM-dependent methyltransferase [Acetobacteraceae bacterium]
MLDIGCNCGAWLRVLLDSGVHDVLGLDVLPFSAEWFVPEENFRQHDLQQPFDLGRRFDLIVCVEVPEHIEPESADQLVASICKHGDTVLWAAALPGQGGQDHVNEQWTEYWCQKFTSHGFEFLDPIRRRIWSNSRVYSWYRQNMVMFATPDAVERSEFLASGRGSTMFSVIHPEGDLWRNMQRRANSSLRSSLAHIKRRVFAN